MAEPGKKSSTYPCSGCGAMVQFQPGVMALTCPYCQAQTQIATSEEDIEELDLEALLRDLASHEEIQERATVQCAECAARVDVPEHVTSTECPYCGTPIVMTATSTRLIKPRSLLPARVTTEEARAAFRSWVTSRWFAPNKLKRYARMERGLKGMYVPYWTFDSRTTSFYRGERGDDHQVTRQRTNAEGKTESYTEIETRWTRVSGVVALPFDDVLVVATRSLPTKLAEDLEPWDLAELVPYADEYLAGFSSESYQIDLPSGFEIARKKMDAAIRQEVKRDIGGDRQRIGSLRTGHAAVTFKHVLLPLWICAYRYHDKAYRFLVNARSGEVQGERPWSWIKITLAAIAAVAAFAGLYYLAGG